MTEKSGITDHTGMTDETAGMPRLVPDYDLPDALALEDPAQYRALFEETRQTIVGMLLERAATISELAQVLDKPKGTVGHHMKVLEEAGLVHVVRTVRVRALEAKYYGRTARTFYYHHVGEAVGESQRVLERAAAQVATAESAALESATAAPGSTEPGQDGAQPGVLNVNRRDARIPIERAAEFSRRLDALLLDFVAEQRAGDTTYALVFGLFPTGAPPLPEPAALSPAATEKGTP